jgi:type II secretory pathway predicted ATPase ExeA
MYRQHFSLNNHPLGKGSKHLWDDGEIAELQTQFQWLLDTPGIGLLTGEPGVGKTAALHSITKGLNTQRYPVIYMAETDFGRLDIYRHLAVELGLEPSYRRATLWREIKQQVEQMHDNRQMLPVWIIDEAQNLPLEFFRDLPAFLNFAFDSRDMMTIWLVGHPILANTLRRQPYAALASRIHVRTQMAPISERDRFAALITHGLKEVGCCHQIISDTGMEMLRVASRGLPRYASRILISSMRLAMGKDLNHLTDDLLKEAIESIQ